MELFSKINIRCLKNLIPFTFLISEKLNANNVCSYYEHTVYSVQVFAILSLCFVAVVVVFFFFFFEWVG